jgi:cytochrome c oxidase cbb3-type subunit 3
MPRWNLFSRRFTIPLAMSALALCAVLTFTSAAQQHIETSSFNQAPLRPKEDPKVVEKGKGIYENQCASCHSSDMRGVENKGPNLLRSQDALTDRLGDNLIPDMLGKNPEMSTHQFDISSEDADAVAAYVRSLVALIGSQGRPPGESTRSPNILVGDAARGRQDFGAKCASCHSVDNDLKGYANKLSSPKLLQASWLRGNHLGVSAPAVTVKVTEPGKPTIEGALIHVDDFLVTLKTHDESTVTIRRRGALPKVEVHDPLEAHRNLLPVYTDSEIHDITAYLVTLK